LKTLTVLFFAAAAAGQREAKAIRRKRISARRENCCNEVAARPVIGLAAVQHRIALYR